MKCVMGIESNDSHSNMESRASIPPGLPHANPTVSYWQDPPAHLATHRTTSSLPSAVSIVIIGSGITGASVAYNILSQQPAPPSVLLLEARTACSGATGRNGGHTKPASYRNFMNNVLICGEYEAAKIVKFEFKCMKAVHEFARENDIECDSWEGDTVDIIYDEEEWERANKSVNEMKRVLGKDDVAAQHTFWNEKETEKRFLVKGAIGAVSYEAGSLNAYKFTVGLLDLSLKKGLNLQTETPALGIIERNAGQNGWIVSTPRGTIGAEKVILATNGYAAHLCPRFQGIIVPLRGHMTTQRLGSALSKGGLQSTYSFIYSNGYEYMIPRPQRLRFAGDIAIGGGLIKSAHSGLYEFGTTDDTKIDSSTISYLQNCAANYFGSNWGHDHPEGRMRNVWTGIMGYSADGFPLIGQVPNQQGLYIAASFQGSGMVLCFLSALALVRLMNHGKEEELEQWFPAAFRVNESRMTRKFRGIHENS